MCHTRTSFALNDASLSWPNTSGLRLLEEFGLAQSYEYRSRINRPLFVILLFGNFIGTMILVSLLPVLPLTLATAVLDLTALGAHGKLLTILL